MYILIEGERNVGLLSYNILYKQSTECELLRYAGLH